MNRPIACALGAALLSMSSAVNAGMPAVLPTDIRQMAYSMSDSAMHRFQAISFFLLVVIVSSLAVRAIWNGLRREFPRLPHLTILRAGGLVFLWGVAMVVVLTMISGARELMTPGAWEKQGFTYRVSTEDAADRDTSGLAQRTARLSEVRVALLRYAALHNGQYPSEMADLSGVSPDLPNLPGLSYRYVAGLNASDTEKVLAYEPDIDRDRRLVLLAGGEIRVCTTEELQHLLANAEAMR